MKIYKGISFIFLILILSWLMLVILASISASANASTKIFQKPSMTCYNVLTNAGNYNKVIMICYDSQLPVACYIMNDESISCIKY